MAQGFQRNVPGVEPATYINRGVVEQADTSLSPLLSGAEMIGGAVKQGYGTGLGEKIMQDTMSEFINVRAGGQEGVTQSIGLDGTVNQFDAEGNALGVSGQVNPELSGDARRKAVDESTASFNKEANKLKRAYESGLIDDRELRARMSLNLKQAEERYPAFKEEIAAQARQMLSDELYYYHYTSTISSLEAMRQKREQEAADAAAQMNEFNVYVAKDVYDKFGIHPAITMQNMGKATQLMQDYQAAQLQDEQLQQTMRREEYDEVVSDNLASANAALHRNMAVDQSNTVIMETLGLSDPGQITQALGGASPEQKAAMTDQIRARREAAIQEVMTKYPNASKEWRQRLVERVSTPFDDMMQAIEEPGLLTYINKANELRESEATRALPNKFVRLGVVQGMIEKLPPTFQAAVQARVANTRFAEETAHFITGDESFDAENSPNIGPGEVDMASQVFDQATRDLTTNRTEFPEGSPQYNEAYDVSTGLFDNIVNKTANLLNMGESRGYDNVLTNVDSIIKLARSNPKLLASFSEESRNVARNNIQRLVTSAGTGIRDWMSEDELGALTVDPNTGLLKVTGATGSRRPEEARSMLSIGRGEAPVSRAQAFIRDMNKSIKAQAALSGDMSIDNIRSISSAVAQSFKVRGGKNSDVKSYVAQLAPSYNLDKEFALSFVNQESRFNPQAVSPAGAAGVMQLMPGTAEELGLTPDERFDPIKAIPAGLTYMQEQMDRAKSLDPSIKPMEQKAVALAMYNAGPGATTQYLRGERDELPQETQDYINIILGGKKNSTYSKLLLNVRNRVMDPYGDGEEG